MKPLTHFLLSSILAIALYPIFKFKVLLILAGGVLIDIDHYLWYAYKYRKFNLFECYKHFVSNTDKNNFHENIGILLPFHTIEFLSAVILLSFFIQPVLVFSIGLLSHYILDLIFLYSVPKRFITNPSLFSWVVKNKIQKV